MGIWGHCGMTEKVHLEEDLIPLTTESDVRGGGPGGGVVPPIGIFCWNWKQSRVVASWLILLYIPCIIRQEASDLMQRQSFQVKTVLQGGPSPRELSFVDTIA